MWPEIRKFASELPLVGPALRSAYRKAHGLPDVEGAQSAAPNFRYHTWIERRVRERAADYPAPTENAPRFDILTLVYNTNPDVLRKTAASVFAQDYAHFRWVIWDNGSSKPETRAALTEIAKDSRVHFHRSEQNLGITTGHLQALELCNAEYIALLDHDDLLYPDALRINAWHIDFFARPDFLYSDEDKCDMQDRRYWPYFKPDFSPALLLDTGYTCHLSVVKRETLLACGAFTDPSVEGAQDWDMALRIAFPPLMRGGQGESVDVTSALGDPQHPPLPPLIKGGKTAAIVHIPEMLYTWRGVPESTAVRGVDAKPHVIAAQKRCVESALERRELRQDFEVQPNSEFSESDGHWRVICRPASEPRIEVVASNDLKIPFKYTGLTICSLRGESANIPGQLNELSKSSTADYFCFFPEATSICHPEEFLSEIVACFELNPKVAVVTGWSFASKHALIGGMGVLGVSGTIDKEQKAWGGYFLMNFCHRNICAAINAPFIVRREAIVAAGEFIKDFSSLYAVDFQVRCVKAGMSVVYSPRLNLVDGIAAQKPSDDELLRFIRAHHDLIRDDPYYSPFCSLKSESLYSIVEPAERAAVLNPLFEKAGVPLVPTDRYELGRYNRLRRKNP